MPIIVMTDLRSQFGPVQHQGSRRTCLSIAASEVHRHAGSFKNPLSVEWLFYHSCQKPGNSPSIGTTTFATQSVLKNTGQPLESVWPYSAKEPTLSKWKPPKNPGTLYKYSTNRINHGILNLVWNKICNKLPVVISFKTSENFIRGPFSSSKTEIPIMRSLNDKNGLEYHAVTVVGCGHFDSNRVFLIRNSWGKAWGNNGHAWLGEDYLSFRISDALAFK